jgi:hypothetical protein
LPKLRQDGKPTTGGTHTARSGAFKKNGERTFLSAPDIHGEREERIIKGTVSGETFSKRQYYKINPELALGARFIAAILGLGV